uniref:(northern house mosquito) hypothetical protein n=1 Tax=Culex pipiens TaxID=7175 RepID=A0A8D8JGH3_CULPI
MSTFSRVTFISCASRSDMKLLSDPESRSARAGYRLPSSSSTMTTAVANSTWDAACVAAPDMDGFVAAMFATWDVVGPWVSLELEGLLLPATASAVTALSLSGCC